MIRWIFTIIILLVPYFSHAQDGSLIANTKTSNIDFKIKTYIYGLWEVKLVTVADKSMAPIAKWFQINKNGTATGGNGWQQNIESHWEFKAINNELLFNTDGIPDEYGAFTVSADKNFMTWARMEEGQNVEVHLELIDTKPLAPWDKIVGLWKWIGMENQDIETDELTISDVEPNWTRMRWDRRFDTFDVDGKRTESGIWHFDAHQPVLTIFDGKDEKFVWQVEFFDNHMVWTSELAGEVLKLTFEQGKSIGNDN